MSPSPYISALLFVAAAAFAVAAAEAEGDPLARSSRGGEGYVKGKFV